MKYSPVLSLDKVKAILQPQFGFIAKSTGEPLWLHAFSVWSVLSKLAARIPRFTKHERLLMEIAALIHDIGKTRASNQQVLITEKGKTKHTATKEEIKEYLQPLINTTVIDLTQNDINVIWEFALHHYVSDECLKEAQTPAFDIYAEVIRYADWLSSMSHLDMSLINQLKSDLEGICAITIFGVGRFPSPTTYQLLHIAIGKYKNLSWEPLVILDDGIVFIGDIRTSLPTREEIVNDFLNLMTQKSFEGHNIKTTFFRYEILSGKAKDDPYSFLLTHKDFYEDKLGDSEDGPVLFFRTLIDLYKNANKLVKARKKLAVIDILAKAGGPNSIAQAKKKWNELIGAEKSWTSVNDFLREIFNKITLEEILHQIELINNQSLKEMTPTELFEVLLTKAKEWFPQGEESKLKTVMSSLICMEEKTDFTKIAQDALERYKRYKRTRKPTQSLCEQCGITVPVEAKESLNFPSSTGFSQINPRPESDAPRVVCPFCVFDATILREGLSSNRTQVYARIVSRVRELWEFYKDLEEFIKRLTYSLKNVYEIKQLKETEFTDLPLPLWFEIPIPKKIGEIRTGIPRRTERGILLPLERIKDKNFKNLRAQYLAFYALLNLMGLETHLGLEEQEGLFGEKVFGHGVNWEFLYYKGLVLIILARCINKKVNKYVYAQSLLEKSPSLVLSKLESAKLKPNLLAKVITFLAKSGLNICEMKGGMYSMKELLSDAAFFAEWIPKFFWTSKDFESWRKGASKYVITKPVDKMLNSLLQGDDFEEAFGKFLSNLKDDISRDKTKPDSKATVDVNDLKIFIEKSKKIFSRYANLRNANITKFIHAKNGLRSATYIFKRYENLKEVIK